MDVLKQMQKLALFQGIPVEKLKALAERALYRTCKAGEMFIGETDPAHAFYVVITGQVKLYGRAGSQRGSWSDVDEINRA